MARALAIRVIERPKLSIWMILIPLFLVFFLQHLSRITSGRESFAGNYLRPRKFLLEETVRSLSCGEALDPESFSRSLSIHEALLPLHGQWVKALSDQYRALLHAEGGDYVSLIRSAYRNRDGYLAETGCLIALEEDFEKALAVTLEKTVPEAGDVVAAVAAHARNLLREDANTFFP